VRLLDVECAAAAVDRPGAASSDRPPSTTVDIRADTHHQPSQLEMFQAGTYDPRSIDADLAAARQIGLNTVRVFLHDQLLLQDRAGFRRRLAHFVDIAARHRIKQQPRVPHELGGSAITPPSFMRFRHVP
jgi:hypothetical protein